MSWDGWPENWDQLPENQMSDLVMEEEAPSIDDYFNKRMSQLDEKDPSPLFQVERHRDDNLFIEQIERADVGSEHPRRRRTSVQKLAMYTVVKFLRKRFDDHWKTLKEFSEAVNDYTIYHNAIKAAATLVYLLFTEEFIYGLARSQTKKKELEQLWQKFVVMGKQGCNGNDLFESIVRDKIIKRYSAVTECDVINLLFYYILAPHCCPRNFDRPYEVPCSCYADKEEEEIQKDPMFEELMGVVRNMKPPQRMKVNGYTRLMINFSNDYIGGYQEMLLVSLMDIVDIDALYKLPDSIHHISSLKEIDIEIKDLLTTLMFIFIEQIKNQVSSVVKPLEELDGFDSFYISPQVFKVIEVAELRRSALGNRFTIEDIFCGLFMRLPPKIRQTVVLNTNNEEDHPAYHFYVTALELANSYGNKMMGLEHLMFAVLYSEDELQVSFEVFLKEVTLDSEERPKVGFKDSSYVLDYGLLCHATLKEMKTLPELQLVIDRFSSTM